MFFKWLGFAVILGLCLSLLTNIYLNSKCRLLKSKLIASENNNQVLKTNNTKLTKELTTINLQYKKADENYKKKLEEYNRSIANGIANSPIDTKRLETIKTIASDPKSDPKNAELEKVNKILNELEFNENTK